VEEVPQCSMYEYGGLQGCNPDTKKEEIIFIGIIDNLTTYSINKKMANFFKNALWDNDTFLHYPPNSKNEENYCNVIPTNFSDYRG